ncbi:MAG: hypothetical protein ACLTAF_06615 [Blautia coccoides]
MEKNKTVFDFLGNMFCIYGITAAMLILFALAFGETAKEISGMFRLGKQGIPLEVMAEFLLTSFLVTCMQYLIFSEKIFKHMSGNRRTVYMLLSIFVITSAAIWKFRWFPVNMWEPWACFFLSFFVSVLVSIGVMRLKIKAEDRKLEEGLKRMKEKWKEEGKES